MSDWIEVRMWCGRNALATHAWTRHNALSGCAPMCASCMICSNHSKIDPFVCGIKHRSTMWTVELSCELKVGIHLRRGTIVEGIAA